MSLYAKATRKIYIYIYIYIYTYLSFPLSPSVTKIKIPCQFLVKSSNIKFYGQDFKGLRMDICEQKDAHRNSDFSHHFAVTRTLLK